MRWREARAPAKRKRGSAKPQEKPEASIEDRLKYIAGLTTPSAPPARWLSAHPPLLCEEGNGVSPPSRFATQCLSRERVAVHRHVVLKFSDRQNAVAVASQIVHVDLMRRPDPLVVVNIGIMGAPHQM